MRTPTILGAILLMLGGLLLVSATIARDGDQQEDAATKIKRCQRIDQPGSYKLAGNLRASGDCLVLTTDGVTIDLAGFAMTGDGTGTAIKGPPAPPKTIPQLRTVVRNGDISNFARATSVSGIVEGLRITSNQNGIFVGIGIVRGNTVLSNAAVGIEVADGIVKDNVVVANQIGISVREAAVVTGNTVLGNETGIDVTGTGSVLIGNAVDGNRKIGLRVNCPSNVVHNTATGNGTNLVMSDATCRNEGNLSP